MLLVFENWSCGPEACQKHDLWMEPGPLWSQQTEEVHTCLEHLGGLSYVEPQNQKRTES